MFVDIFSVRDYFRTGKVMTDRRAEKRKKIRISPKQRELYNRLKYSRVKSSKK